MGTKQFRRARYLVTALTIGVVAAVCPFNAQAQTVPFPTAIGSGYFNYDGSALTLTTLTTVTMVLYSTTESAFMPMQDPAVGAILQLSGVNQVGSSYAFSDGVMTLATPGGDTLMSADIVNTLLVPTSAHTGTINASQASINLQNVIVSQPSTGSSRFVTDWLAVTGGSQHGAIGLTLTNTDTGSIDPLAAPASGTASFTLQPAVPEPASLLLLLLGAFGLKRRR